MQNRSIVPALPKNNIELPAYSVTKVKLSTIPSGGEISILELGSNHFDGATVDLNPGFYRLVSTKAGFRDGNLRIEISGLQKQERVEVPLGEGFAAITIKTGPSGGTLNIDGVVVGRTPMTLELSAGQHEIRVSAVNHKTRSMMFEVLPGEPETIDIDLEPSVVPQQKAVIFAEDQAVSQPKSSVRQALKTGVDGQKPASLPVLLTLDLDPSYDIDDQALGLKAKGLYGLLNSADVLVFRRQGDTGVLVKKPELGVEAFIERLLICLRNPEAAETFTFDREQKYSRAGVAGGKAPLANIMFALQRSRTDQAMLDIEKVALSPEGEMLYRTKADGQISFLSHGGSGLLVSGAKIRRYGDLAIGRLPAGNDLISMSWEEKPLRLLVVAEKKSELEQLDNNIRILGREKKIFALKKTGGIQSLVQHSFGPEYQDSSREDWQPDALFNHLLSINNGEVGPHLLAGNYRRLWIVRYFDGTGVTQRQVAVNYQVLDKVKRYETDVFLRRKQPKPSVIKQITGG